MSAPTAERRLADLQRAIREGAGLAHDASDAALLEVVTTSLAWTRRLPAVLRALGAATQEALINEVRVLRAFRAKVFAAIGAGPAGIEDVEAGMAALREALGLEAGAPLAQVVSVARSLAADRAAVEDALRAAGVPSGMGPALSVLSLVRRVAAVERQA